MFVALNLILVASIAVSASYTPLISGNKDRVGPLSIAPDMDCAVRTLAAEMSVKLLPWAPPALVTDALQLAIDCPNSTALASQRALPMRSTRMPRAGVPTFFADAVNGDDNAAGTQAAPFRSINRALTASRAAGGTSRSIVLRAGTFFLPAALELGVLDSGLTISAFPGETPVISAGTPLARLSWSPVPPSAPTSNMTGPFQGSLLDMPAGGGCVASPGSTNPGVCAPLGQFSAAAECAAACLANTSCTGYTWHDVGTGDWAHWCYARLDGYESSDHASDHVCGWKPASPANNLWQAKVPAGVQPFDQLFFRGRRLVRARWPNANPETDLAPHGFVAPHSWDAPKQYGAPNETNVSTSDYMRAKTDPLTFQPPQSRS